jgi:methylthioribose-1-phosphate isomerase
MSEAIVPIRRDAAGHVIMLDQTQLPLTEVYHTYRTAEEVAQAIETMIIRGAPAIGVAAAFGLALGARGLSESRFSEQFSSLCQRMASTRPTAVNLFWAIDKMKTLVAKFQGTHSEKLAAMDEAADTIYHNDIATNRSIGAHGNEVIPRGARILTHCNTGSLATAGYGTALGVIRAAHEAGKDIHVIADETRPYLQGGRLTAWECVKEQIPITLIADNAAGHLISQGLVDVAIVGADRIAANGDTANKIGTYQVAVLCHRHGIPFYVAAPTTTLDLSIQDGSQIPIEERSPEEVRTVFGKKIAPIGVPVANPAFDVTPAELIAGIVTEKGIARAPFAPVLARMFDEAQRNETLA